MSLENFCALCGSLYNAGALHTCTNAPRSAPYPLPPPSSLPTSAARPMQGLAHWLRARAGDAATPVLLTISADALRRWASEVEAVQAQPASITESLPICTKVPLVFAQPASAPMGLSEERVRELMQVAQRWAGPDEGDWRSDEMEMALRAVRVGISGESSGAARKDDAQAPALFSEANDPAHPDYVAAQATESVYLADHAPAVGVQEKRNG